MHRFWSILFLLVPILAIGTYIIAALNLWPFNGAWMPESFSESGDTIDDLFNGLHLLSAAILVGTMIAISWIVWRFNEQNESAMYIQHNTKLEITWSLIPAAILVFIAFYQMNSWAENKMNRPTVEVAGKSVPKPPLCLVRAKQFGWEFHYAGKDGKVQTADDIYVENELVVPVDEEVVLQLESNDVIHSFFVAELRLKQDIVPQMVQFAWFKAYQEGQMEIACTELCGWGHYKMKARLRIVSRTEFDQWINNKTIEYSPFGGDDQDNGEGNPAP